jgi:phosphoenolpyruvate-protein kinase (PTS system EI component)
VCGELAANTAWTQVFLDMKVSGLSMTSYNVLSVRKQLHDLQVKA